LRLTLSERNNAEALMMKAASTSETSVNFYQTTRRNNPEDSHLHTRRRENLKSHLVNLYEATLHYIRIYEALRIKKNFFTTHRPDDGDSKDLLNVGKLLPDYIAQQPRRQPSSV
jgi:hypothetical protein